KCKFAPRCVALLAMVTVLAVATRAKADDFGSNWPAIQEAISQVPEEVGVVYDVHGSPNRIRIINFGKVVYVGPVDVFSTLDRIRGNQKLPHDNDGTVFTNVEKLLPDAPKGYYHEFVHWPFGLTEHPYGMSFPGPMRVILGAQGEVYFTGDHYST